MSEQTFRVIVTNMLLGNSEQIMTLDEIESFNRVAYLCALAVLKHGGSQSSGMWTVELMAESEETNERAEGG